MRPTVKWFVIVWLAFGNARCGSDPADRYAAQAKLGSLFVNESLHVHFEPGARPIFDAENGLALVASGPTPVLTIEHWGRSWSEMSLAVDSVFPNSTASPVFSYLEGGPAFACPERSNRADLMLAPLVPDEAALPELFYPDLRLAPCSRLTVRFLPPGSLGQEGFQPLRIAVIGEMKGNDSTMASFIDHIGSPATVDLIVALGNLANSAGWVDLDGWRREMASVSAPVIAVMGPDEAQGGVPLAFHEVFGRSDFSFEVGDVQFFIMDTASAGLSDAQFAYWEDQLDRADGKVRLVFMHTPPFDPSGTREQGFLSRHQASRLISLLGRSRVDAVFTAGGGTYRLLTYGDIPFHSTGGGGGSLELGDDWGHHFLRLTVDPGAEEEVVVEIVGL